MAIGKTGSGKAPSFTNLRKTMVSTKKRADYDMPEPKAAELEPAAAVAPEAPAAIANDDTGTIVAPVENAPASTSTESRSPKDTAAPPPAPARKPAKPSAKAPEKTDDKDDGAKTVMKGRVRFPAAGQFEAYDKAVAAYGEQLAQKTILANALAVYEAAVLSGSITKPQPRYVEGNSVYRYTRLMSTDAYTKAKAVHDPLGMLTEPVLFTAICRDAVSAYLGQR